jgi:uncharacterized membrane protein
VRRPGRALLETRRRSVAKALSWRVVGTLDTLLLSFLVTGRARLAVTISLIEVLTKMALYFAHERAWSRVRYGQDVPGLEE